MKGLRTYIRIVLQLMTNLEKHIIYCEVYAGMREIEIAHLLKSDVHIGDEKAERIKSSYIQIPSIKRKCKCKHCTKQAFVDYKKGNRIKMNKEWYRNNSKQFSKLKREGNLPELDIYYLPKKSSVRKIPIMNREFELHLKYFPFHKFELTTDQIYQKTVQVGNRVFPSRKVYPNSLRATAVSYHVEHGVNPSTIRKICGYKSTVSLDQYYKQKGGIIQELKEIKGLK